MNFCDGTRERPTDRAQRQSARAQLRRLYTALLRARYRQYRSMRLEDLPVIALRVARVTTWGTLAALPAEPASHAGT